MQRISSIQSTVVGERKAQSLFWYGPVIFQQKPLGNKSENLTLVFFLFLMSNNGFLTPLLAWSTVTTAQIVSYRS